MQSTMYPGRAFSPQTATTDTISASATVIPVADTSVFPAAPNYATIGTDADGETVLYSAKTASALSGCTRGVEGVAKSWPSGSVIGRNFTAKDLDVLQANTRDLDSRMQNIEDTGGYVFTPSVSQDGVISWTNDGGLPNPSSVNIKGPKPVKGADYWTTTDRQQMVTDVLNALPTWNGGSY